jgi:hypothetical protein
LVHVFDVEVVEVKLFSFHPSPLKPSPNLITLQLQGSSTLIFLKKAQYIFIKKHFAFGSFLQWNRFEFQWIIGKDYLQDTATSYWTKKKKGILEVCDERGEEIEARNWKLGLYTIIRVIVGGATGATCGAM